jgi:polysaccharide pyruvyl transferase WcaK-like protein
MLRSNGVKEKSLFLERWDNLDTAAAYLLYAQLVVSNRLHALLLAASFGVPILGISHQVKIIGCLEMLGEKKACSYIEQNKFLHNYAAETINNLLLATSKDKLDLTESIKKWGKKKKGNLEVVSKFIS